MLRAALAGSLLVLGLLAGCAEDPPPAPTVEAPPAPVPVDEAVDWSATIGSYHCLQAVAVTACGFTGPSVTDPLGDADATPTLLHDAKDRDLAGGTLTLEWQAVTPTTEALRLVVEAWTGCPSECEANRTVASSIGTSPLQLALPAKELGEGFTLAMRVEVVNFFQNSKLSLGQPVHLAGTLSFVEPAEEPRPEGPGEGRQGRDGEAGG